MRRLKNNCNQITSIDPFIGFRESILTTFCTDCTNWNQVLWQKNTQQYSDRIRYVAGSAIPILSDLARHNEKFDLIFYDASHGCETPFEVSLISCIASEYCTLILDDVINHNSIMTSAWAIGLKNLFAFPRFAGRLSIANFKRDLFPTNIKFEPSTAQLSSLIEGIEYVCKKGDLSLISFDI